LQGPDTSLDSTLPSILRKIGARLPFWPATIIAGIIPVLVLLGVEDQLGNFDTVSDFLSAFWIVSALIIFFIFAMKFSWTRIERLVDYANQMSRDKPGLQIRSPLRPTWILLAWAGVLGGIIVLFGLPEDLHGVFTDHILTLGYFFLVSSCFLLVYGYSMVTIYRAGKLSLELKPFTEDRMLGLRPFGMVSLRLASVYAIFPIVYSIINSISVTSTPTGLVVGFSGWRLGDAVLTAVLVIIGVGLFFLPLASIHRQLVDAKKRELTWINPQYSNLIHRMKQDSQANKASFADELSLVRQIQSDVHGIREWPFGLGMLSRLVIILLLPPVLTLVGRFLVRVVLNL